MGRSYQPQTSETVVIGANLMALMQKCMEMDFFEDKKQINKCFFEITPDEATAIEAVLKGDQTWIQARLIEALQDEDFAQEVCDLLPTKLTEVQ